MRREKARIVASGLLDRAGLSLEALAEKALSRRYWQELFPFFSVEASSPSQFAERHPITPSEQHELVNRFKKEGYFETESIISERLTELMEQCIEKIRQEGWPATFSYVYDQFWIPPRLSSLRRIAASILGPGHKQTGEIWTHYVPAIRGCTGWSPHVDNQKPGRLTLWVSINGATPENGCVYLIPKEPDTLPLTDRRLIEGSMFNGTEVCSLLQHSIALPAKPGAVLGWNHDVIHWGSANRSKAPRISFAMELIASNVAPDSTLFNLDKFPTFDQRISAICQSILQYGVAGSISPPFEHQPRHLQLAMELTDRAASH